MKLVSVLIAVVVLGVFDGVFGQQNITAGLPREFRAYKWMTGLGAPRQMVAFPNGDVIVVENGRAQITLLYDSTGTRGYADTKLTWGTATGLQSNIQYNNGFVYASNSTHIFRWPFTQGSRTPPATATVVIRNMPSNGHVNRPHDFDPEGRMYVSIGSNSNVDSDASRSFIARFDSSLFNSLPIDYSSATIFASGTRNEAGLRFNRYGQLWGVENGMDDLNRSDLGGDIHQNNPGEELNLFPDRNGVGPIPIGAFYGYPYCFSEYIINSSKSAGRGSQWAVSSFQSSGINDTWCNNPNSVIKPKFLMPAHNAPLDIVFYESNNINYQGNWPSSYLDSAFIALHGSWNRSPPSGYRVLQITFDNNHNPISSTPFFFDPVPGEEIGNSWSYRPSGVQFANCGGVDCLLVASDATNDITAVVYEGAAEPTSTPSAVASSGAVINTVSPSPTISSGLQTDGADGGDGSGAAGLNLGLVMAAIQALKGVL